MLERDDLIARLRNRANWETMTSEFESEDHIDWMAADEIERLCTEYGVLADAARELVLGADFNTPSSGQVFVDEGSLTALYRAVQKDAAEQGQA